MRSAPGASGNRTSPLTECGEIADIATAKQENLRGGPEKPQTPLWRTRHSRRDRDRSRKPTAYNPNPQRREREEAHHGRGRDVPKEGRAGEE